MGRLHKTSTPRCPRCPGTMVWLHNSWQCPDCKYKEGCCS